MYRLLIIDDESSVRHKIRSSLSREFTDIEIIGEAANGLEGLIKIEEYSPDIVICDIRTTPMNGIAFSTCVRSDHPDLQFIFLSEYADREYLKKALSQNATYYLFKPFHVHELLMTVNEAKKICAQKKRLSNDKKNKFAQSLLNYYYSDNPHILGNAEYPPRESSAPMVTLLILLNPPQVEFSGMYLEKSTTVRMITDRYYADFRDVTHRLFGPWAMISPTGTGYAIHANVNMDFPAQSCTLCQEFFNIIPESRNILSIGISNVYSDISKTGESYRQALEAARSSFLSGWGKILSYQDLNRTPFVPAEEIAVQFYQPLIQNDYDTAIDWLKKYIDYMCSCRAKDIPAIRESLADILYWFRNKLPDNARSLQYISDMIYTAADINEIKIYILADIRRYAINLSQLSRQSQICLNAEQYILSNLDKSLQIRDIASRAFITPNYLCYLYKKQKGKTIYQFILECKMDRARRLLCEDGMKISDISDTLGYANQNYFTRIFTKFYGTSPGQYRNTYMQQNQMKPDDNDSHTDIF